MTTADFIAGLEQFRTKAYYDVNGYAVGFGSHNIGGVPVVSGQSITKPEAVTQLNLDIGSIGAWVDTHVKVPLTENQRSSLISVGYNMGVGNLGKTNLIAKLNQGDYAGASGEFSKLNTSAGKVSQPVIDRRVKEKELFDRPSGYNDLPNVVDPPYSDMPTIEDPQTKPKSVYRRARDRDDATLDILMGMGRTAAQGPIAVTETAKSFFDKITVANLAIIVIGIILILVAAGLVLTDSRTIAVAKTVKKFTKPVVDSRG